MVFSREELRLSPVLMTHAPIAAVQQSPFAPAPAAQQPPFAPVSAILAAKRGHQSV